LRLRNARLPHKINDSAEKRQQNQCGRGHARFMSLNVSGGEIDQRALAGDDRFTVQMPGDVFAEIASRAIKASSNNFLTFRHCSVVIFFPAPFVHNA
jgi:hypothetical protein